MIKFCSLFSGSSGNVIFVSDGKTRILIDVGISTKRIIDALHSINEDPSMLDAVLITHEHIDHIAGAGSISRRFDIPIYANEGTWNAMQFGLGDIKCKNRVVFSTDEQFYIDDILVHAFPIPHDAAEPVGYNLYAANRKITVATDIGKMDTRLMSRMEKSDLLMLESNHDVEMLMNGSYPWPLKKRISGGSGHLSNDTAARVVTNLAKMNMYTFILGHLSRENNSPGLAERTTCDMLEENDIRPGKDIYLDIAQRDSHGRVVTV
jgi:phosphoribosyl 1,2-cyclic phosphodiesterase